MGLALALALALGASEDGRGASGLPPEVALARRPAPRVHATLGVGAGLQLARSVSAYGVALTGDLGVVFGDRLSISVHGVASSLVLTVHGSLGAGVDYLATEHWSLGLGVALAGWFNGFPDSYGTFFGVTAPVRVAYLFHQRRPTEVSRRGLVVALEVAPGFDVRPTTFFGSSVGIAPEFGTTVVLSLGYAVR